MCFQVTVSSEIYTAECLKEAALVYQELCSVRILDESPVDCTIEIKSSTAEVNELQATNEFLNYLLDLSLERHLGEMG